MLHPCKAGFLMSPGAVFSQVIHLLCALLPIPARAFSHGVSLCRQDLPFPSLAEKFSFGGNIIFCFNGQKLNEVRVTQSALYLPLFVFCKHFFYVGLLSSETNGGTCLGMDLIKDISFSFFIESYFLTFVTSMVFVHLVYTLAML